MCVCVFFFCCLIDCGSTDQDSLRVKKPQSRLVFTNGTQRYQDIRNYLFFFRNKEKQVSAPFAKHALGHCDIPSRQELNLAQLCTLPGNVFFSTHHTLQHGNWKGLVAQWIAHHTSDLEVAGPSLV